MKFAIGVAAALLISGSLSAFAAGEPEPTYATQIRGAAARFTHNFAAKNAAAIASEWTVDGTYVDDIGQVYVGRDAVQKLYESYLQAAGEQPGIAVDIDSIKMTTPNVVIERGHSTLLDPHGHALSEAPYVAIHHKVGNEWPISEFVEYASKRKAATPPDLNWLIGTWKSTSGDKTITLNNRLSSGGKFLISEFTAPEGEKTGDVMISGINPSNGNLDCWIFDTTGGVGKGRWSYGDGVWYLRNFRVEPDGKHVLLTHVLKPDSANSFDWMTTNRFVDGQELPDVPPTHVQKISSEAK